MAYRLLPAYQARIARRGISANSNLTVSYHTLLALKRVKNSRVSLLTRDMYQTFAFSPAAQERPLG